MHHLAYALRLLRREPMYVLGVGGVLTLAIGATAVVFAIVRGVVLRPLPFPDPDRLVALWESDPRAGYPKFRVAAGNYADWTESNRVFSTLALFGAATFQLTGDGDPEQLEGASVDGRYFATLQVPPVLGRWLTADDGRSDESVAVISHGLWTRRLARRPDVIGRTIWLDGRACTIVGVMPPGIYPTWPRTTGGFEFLPRYQQIWTPLAMPPWLATTRRTHVFGVVGRLRSDVGLAAARRQMDEIARRLQAVEPATNAGVGVLVTRLYDEVSGDVRLALLVLLGAVGLVFAATSATLVNLALLRSTSRQREMAIRAALGGLAGLLVARWSLPAVLALAPKTLPRAGEIVVDASVVAWALGMSGLAACICGVMPAWKVWRTGISETLTQGGRASQAPVRSRLRHALVAVEVAMSVVLLVGTGLAARSYCRLRHVDLGFSPTGVLAFELSLPHGYSARSQIEAFQSRLLERLAALPGAVSAAIGYDLPLEAAWVDSYRVQGRPAEADPAPSAILKIGSQAFFATLGIQRVSGRTFSEGDRRGRPGVVTITKPSRAASSPRGLRSATASPSARLRPFGPTRPWSSRSLALSGTCALAGSTASRPQPSICPPTSSRARR